MDLVAAALLGVVQGLSEFLPVSTRDLMEVGMSSVPGTLLAAGMATSAIVGSLTIRFFLRYGAHHSLEVFAYYRFALAGATVVWLMTRGTP